MFSEYFVGQRSEPTEYHHNITTCSNVSVRKHSGFQLRRTIKENRMTPHDHDPQHEAQAFRDNSTSTRMTTDTDDVELVDQRSD